MTEKNFYHRVENTMGKRRNYSLRAFSPFLPVFSKDLYGIHVKTRACFQTYFFFHESPSSYFSEVTFQRINSKNSQRWLDQTQDLNIIAYTLTLSAPSLNAAAKKHF